MPRDFAAVASAALGRAHELVAAWLPDGRPTGHEWVALNPTRPDTTARSFSINLHTGAWADFAGGDRDKGGDLISLLAYIRHGGNQGAACDELARELGMSPNSKIAPAAPAARAVPPPPDDLVVPAPADAPDFLAILEHPVLGRAVGHWPYHDAEGRLLMVVVRWDESKRDHEGQFFTTKTFRPYTLRRDDAGRLAWRPKGLPNPRPLYRLDELARRRDAVVVVCEGEKAADAAQRLLPQYVATTSPNGAKNPQYADWSSLRDRVVMVWPDADEPGRGYAEAVVRLLRGLAAEVRVVELASVAAIRERVMGGGGELAGVPA